MGKSSTLLQIQIQRNPAFPRKEQPFLHGECTFFAPGSYGITPPHTPCVYTHATKPFLREVSASPVLFLPGISTSWRFSAQKGLIRSFLTSSAAACHAPSAPLPGRNRSAQHAKKLPKHSPLLPRRKLELPTRISKNDPILKKTQRGWSSFHVKSKSFTTLGKLISSIKG